MQPQPPDHSPPRFSPDGMWWWDGAKWVPATQPAPPQPAIPPTYYTVPPPATFGWQPSPGLRVFLIVFLVLQALVFGLLTIGGVAAIASGPVDAGSIVFWVVVAALFVLPVAAVVGVFLRTSWARWVALASGIAVSLTCLGSVLGIPIIVAASRAPLGKPRAS